MIARNKIAETNIRPRLTGLDGFKTYTGLGTTKAKKLADEAGAVVHIGTRCLYDLNVIDAHIDKLREAEQGGAV